MNIKQQMLSYTGVNIVNASVPFLLLPFLTTYLSPNDYGILSLIQLLMLISLPLLMMNTQGLIKIDYSKLSFEELQIFLSTIIWIPLMGFIFLEFIFFLFKEYIIKYLHIPTEYIYYIPIFILFQAVPTIVAIIFQAKKEPLNFGKFKISMTLTNLFLSLLFIIVFNYSWEGRLGGIVASFFLFTIIGLIILFRLNLLKLKFSIKPLKEALKFGLPFVPHTIAGVFLIMSDRIFLANILGENSVGIYSVAFQISSAVTIIMSSINQAWAPNLYEKLNNNPTYKDKKDIVITTYKIMGLMLIITIAFVIISPFIYDVFIDSRYQEGKSLVYIISFAFLLQGFYYMITNYILYSKKTHILSYITSFCVGIVFLSNYILIPKFGIMGSAYAMLITWMTFFCISWYVSNKIYSMPWRLK